MESGADARRAGRSVQPGDQAGVHAAAEQEAQEQDHRLGDVADQAAHGFHCKRGAGRFRLVVVPLTEAYNYHLRRVKEIESEDADVATICGSCSCDDDRTPGGV